MDFKRAVCLGLLAAVLTGAATAAGEARVFRYQNPISSGIDPRGLRDCQVFRDGGKWYLTGTAYPVWPKEGNIRIAPPSTFSRELVLP